jgi:hypothetical protein
MRTVLPALRQGSERILAAGRQRVSAASVAVDTLTIECFARRPCDVIVEAAVQWPADLIVIGTHGRRGVNRMMLGSDAEQVARMAPVPVLLVRSAGKASSERLRSWRRSRRACRRGDRRLSEATFSHREPTCTSASSSPSTAATRGARASPKPSPSRAS